MEYWSDTVTLYSLCGDVYARTAVFEGCFWQREDSEVYEDGRRRTVHRFTVRIPGVTLIIPGDILARGDVDEKADAEYIKAHAESAFRVSEVSMNDAKPRHLRCGGESIA